MLKKSLALSLSLLSFSLFAAKLVPVKNQPLEFNCQFRNEYGEKDPYLIRVSRGHKLVKISFKKRGMVITDMKKVGEASNDSHLFMVFRGERSPMESLTLTTPNYMSEFLGASNQLASLQLSDGYLVTGPCSVKFRPLVYND